MSNFFFGTNFVLKSDIYIDIRRYRTIPCAFHHSREALARLVAEEKARLEASLEDESWKVIFPGKFVFRKFCGDFLNEDANRVQQAYVDLALQDRPEALQDLIDILNHFQSLKR